jgi:hypothetical protein
MIIALGLVILGLLGVRAQPADAYALPNAIGAYDSNPYGVKSSVSTADPQIRDGAYSWARPASLNMTISGFSQVLRAMLLVGVLKLLVTNWT